MNLYPLSDFMPRLIYSLLWEGKDKFLYYEDTCREWTMFAVTEGSFHYELAGETGLATFGDLLLCPPRLPFRRVVVAPLTFFHLKLRWEHISGNRDRQPVMEGKPIAGKIRLFDTHRLAATYKMMTKAEALDVPRQKRIRNMCLHHIWLMYCQDSGAEQWMLERTERKQPDPLIAQAAALIEKSSFGKVDLKDISASLGISQVRLTQRFKADYGVSPIQYLTSIRLERAKMLLLETNLTVDQISDCVGYQNGYYLSRLFAKHFRLPPAAFRKAHRV